ncbi:MAG: energy-coupling factor transporter ATPase [Eubacteriales bacterium]|nr:energy-coupling factor transporter ATPase [Eubacteriales bacterium]
MGNRMKLLNIKNLSFEYFRRDDDGKVAEVIEALHDVNLDVKQGQFIAILGRNGSGKSTLAKHMNALLTPSEGEVIVDGMDTSDEEVRLQIRKTAGMVFQNPDNQIVSNLVEEDIAFGPENLGVPTAEIWNRVEQVLEWTGMEKYRYKSPNHLSGGQKQRVAIAGVLAMEPKCIIFDEATAMLDPMGRRKMLTIAKTLQEEQNITIILITHHMEEVLFADSVYVMKDGKIVTFGSPREVFEKQAVITECGLCLPVFYEYMSFMKLHGMLTQSECEQIENREELYNLVINKYRLKEHGTVWNAPTSNQNENKSVEQEIQGLLLHQVGYIYNKGYADEHYALKNVNISIGQGEFVAIVGHTGSGKSTLMQHLNGLLLPTEGQVFFNGQDISDKDFSLKMLRQKVGMVFQYPEHQLFEETVEKDVCFGPENMNIPKVEAQKRAYEAIAAVGLPDTIYDYSPLQLSGGQKRRVAIAGVLAMKPEFLVLDEPTAGLDPKSGQELLTMLKALQQEQGITVVLVSHDMEQVAEYADRVIVMDQGEIILDGKPNRVFEQKDELERIGLEVPFGIDLLHGLINVENELDGSVYRKNDVFSELLKIKG